MKTIIEQIAEHQKTIDECQRKIRQLIKLQPNLVVVEFDEYDREFIINFDGIAANHVFSQEHKMFYHYETDGSVTSTDKPGEPVTITINSKQ